MMGGVEFCSEVPSSSCLYFYFMSMSLLLVYSFASIRFRVTSPCVSMKSNIHDLGHIKCPSNATDNPLDEAMNVRMFLKIVVCIC